MKPIRLTVYEDRLNLGTLKRCGEEFVITVDEYGTANIRYEREPVVERDESTSMSVGAGVGSPDRVWLTLKVETMP